MASVQNTLDRLNTWERFAFAYYAYVARAVFFCLVGNICEEKIRSGSVNVFPLPYGKDKR